MATSQRTRIGAPAVLLVLAVLLTLNPGTSRSAPELIEDPAWLREKLEEVREKHGLPAIAACLVVKGEVVAASAVGVRLLGTRTPVTRDDPFLTCSVTKPMTATMIARLVDAGILRWDLTLAQGLPPLQHAMKSAYRSVTIAQLLAHVSGLPYEPTRADPDSPEDAEQAMAKRQVYSTLALLDEPVAEPGTRVVYGGGSIVAASIAERRTGMVYEHLMRKHVFGPLGMTTAGFGPMASSAEAIDAPWEHRMVEGALTPHTPDKTERWHVRAPAGNVHCSIIDLGRFAAAHARPAAATSAFLRAETVARLHSAVGAGMPPGFASSEVEWSCGPVLWHNGSNGRNTAVLNIAPAEGMATCVMTNAGGLPEHGEACGTIHRFLVERAKTMR